MGTWSSLVIKLSKIIASSQFTEGFSQPEWRSRISLGVSSPEKESLLLWTLNRQLRSRSGSAFTRKSLFTCLARPILFSLKSLRPFSRAPCGLSLLLSCVIILCVHIDLKFHILFFLTSPNST